MKRRPVASGRGSPRHSADERRKRGDHNGAVELAAGQCQTAPTRAAGVRTEQQLRTTMASRYGELNKTETAARAELAQPRYTAELQRQERQQRQNEEAAASYTPPPRGRAQKRLARRAVPGQNRALGFPPS